jgi:hypothetical protein
MLSGRESLTYIPKGSQSFSLSGTTSPATKEFAGHVAAVGPSPHGRKAERLAVSLRLAAIRSDVRSSPGQVFGVAPIFSPT